MPKKKQPKQKQKQKQRQSQSVKVVVNLAKPKARRRRRTAPREPASMMPQQIPLPPVVYQVPTPITFYGQPEPAREQSLVNVGERRPISQKINWEVVNEPSQVLENPAENVEFTEPVRKSLADQNININTMESVKTGKPRAKVRMTADKEIASSGEDDNTTMESASVGGRVHEARTIAKAEKEREKAMFSRRGPESVASASTRLAPLNPLGTIRRQKTPASDMSDLTTASASTTDTADIWANSNNKNNDNDNL